MILPYCLFFIFLPMVAVDKRPKHLPVIMTPERFLQTFSDEDSLAIVKKYSENISPSVYKKACNNSLDALFVLVNTCKEKDGYPPLVSMYWESKIAQHMHATRQLKELIRGGINVKYLRARKKAREMLAELSEHNLAKLRNKLKKTRAKSLLQQRAC